MSDPLYAKPDDNTKPKPPANEPDPDVLDQLGIDKEKYAEAMAHADAIGFTPFDKEQAEGYINEVLETLKEIGTVCKSASDRIKIRQYPAALEAIGAAGLGLGMAHTKVSRLIFESIGAGLARAMIGANASVLSIDTDEHAPMSKPGDGYL